MKKILSLIFCILVAVLFANVFAAADGNEDIIAVSNEYFLKQTGLTEDDFKWFEVSIAEKQNGYSVQYSFCHTVEDPKYLSILKQVSIVWPFPFLSKMGMSIQNYQIVIRMVSEPIQSSRNRLFWNS